MSPYSANGLTVATALLHTAGIGAGFALKLHLAWLAYLSGVDVVLYSADLLVTAVQRGAT